MTARTTAFVFARGGSKGVPGKNIRPLAGKPLIAHAIETACKSKYIERVVVSTDDKAIAAAAKAAGAEVPFMRPPELATDESPEWLAWQHAIKNTGVKDIFVSVPATCPFRSVEDIDRCIETLMKQYDTDVVITATPAHSNPYFTGITADKNGLVSLVASPSGRVVRRQDAPRVWNIVGVAYAARPDFVLHAQGLWDGKVRMVEVPQERALDIDTEFDFKIAELLKV